MTAVWLHGSLGRGDGDHLSDLDVWVVVADEHWQGWLTQRDRIMAQIGKPLILLNVPTNAPSGGSFMTVVFEGPAGPLNLDLSIQPQSHARVPEGVRLLFDRVGIPAQVELPTGTSQDRTAELSSKVNFFWAMLPNVAKLIYRRKEWDALRLIMLLRDVVWQTAETTGVLWPSDPDQLPTSGLAQLEYLRTLADRMKVLDAQMAVPGSLVPSEAMVAVYNFLDMVAREIQ